MKRAFKQLSLSTELFLLPGIPFLAVLAFAGVLAGHTFEVWRNVHEIVALGRLVTAAEEYTRAIPAEAIVSLGALETRAADQRALMPAARTRTDAAVASLRQQAAAAGVVDEMALKNLNLALTLPLSAVRARFDAGTETLADILVTLRPATLQAVELVGRLAALSNDARVSRLMLAYTTALWMNDALLVERNVRPIAQADGTLAASAAYGEAVGVAQQDMLAQQFERLAAPEALPAWHQFLADPATQEIAALRHSVLGVGGSQVDISGMGRWTEVSEQRLRAMAPVLAISASSLRRAVTDLQDGATATLVTYALLLPIALSLILIMVGRTRRRLAARIGQLSDAMDLLANGDLTTPIPPQASADELGTMELTLASFKASLIERNRLAAAQAAAAAALLDEKERLRVTLHSIGDGMIVTDADRCVTMMNGAAEALTGWTLCDALGRTIDSVLMLTSSQGQDPLLGIGTAQGSATAADGDCMLRRRDGQELAIDASAALIFGQDGGMIGSIMVLHDVTEARSLLKRIRQLAHYDTLTGLPNRALFQDRLGQAVVHSARCGHRFALLFLDMDRFKYVNDTLGHAAGDLLLREVAQRLAMTVRESDAVARIGGDEFVVIVHDLTDTDAASIVARKILESIHCIDRIAGHEINVSFSIGIAIYPDDAQDAEQLLMRADAAMYQAKDAGRNAAMFYDPDMDRATQSRNQMRMRLAKALQLQQFIMLYQPKIDLDTGQVTGAEALIRWHPEPGKIISPLDFIPIAEESGLIVQIGDWVIGEACRQMRAWAQEGLPPIPVSVNVSMKSLRDPGFVESLRSVITTASIPAQSLEIEITESVAMADPERTLAILADIRALGVRVSIDDFGTGFSSLSHLRRLPVDTIKIDRSFVRNMVEVEDDAALVRAIIGMANSMRKHVIAEGVETEKQCALLRRFGCHEAQGFLFSVPVEPDALTRILVQERNHVPAC